MDLVSALQRSPVLTGARPGTVRAVAASRLTVEVEGVQVKLPFGTGTYAVGDTVLVLDGYVLTRLGAPPAPPPPPPPPPQPTVQARTATLLPTFTGSFRAGRWRDGTDVYQGDYGGYGVNTGAAYYGDQFVALNARLDQPRSAVVHYRRQRGGDYAAQAPTFWTLGERGPDGDGPARHESQAGAALPVDGAVDWALPGAWLDALLAGTRGGLGTFVNSSNPYLILDGRGDYARAFAVTVNYYA